MRDRHREAETDPSSRSDDSWHEREEEEEDEDAREDLLLFCQQILAN